MCVSSGESGNFAILRRSEKQWQGLAALALLAMLVLLAQPSRAAGDDAGKRLGGHVLSALATATPLAPGSLAADGLAATEQDQFLSMTFVLNRDDEAGFQRYLHDVYDPQSPAFRQFLPPTAISDRFGPSAADYERVLAHLQTKGFQLSEGSANRLTLTVRGTRAQVEQALDVQFSDYRAGSRTFYANDRDPALPAEIAARVQSITGLSSLAQPEPNVAAIINAFCRAQSYIIFTTDGVTSPTSQQLYEECLSAFASLAAYGGGVAGGAFGAQRNGSAIGSSSRPDTLPPWLAFDGTGQRVGLVEFDAFDAGDVADYLNLIGNPASQLAQLSTVPVNGGTTIGAGESEVLLDIDTVMTVAPGAEVVVYEGALGGANAASYQQMFNAMIGGGVTIISNSWSYCEDQTTFADVSSIDSILQAAAASGITVFNGSGDSGSTCLDGSTNTIGVPADSPNATAVGGTTLTHGSGNAYVSETWWNGSAATPQTGQGGFGTSRFFARPAYQNGYNPAATRSIPDVAINADPATGIVICQRDDGGCPTGLLYGGTSYAAPLWAALHARLNQAQGHNLGALNPLIYPLANTSAFHSASSMGSTFAHVGLGSPNLNAMHLLLASQATGPVSATESNVSTYLDPDTVLAPGFSGVPDDGSSKAAVVVTLRDSAGNIIGGKTVVLTASAGSHAVISPASAVSDIANGTAAFTLTDSVAESFSVTAADTSDNVTLTQSTTVAFGVSAAAAGSIVAFTDAVVADGVSTDTITVTLEDAMGRPASGKLVTLAQTGNSVISGPSPGVTGSNGEIVFTVTDTVQETITYTATDVTDGGLPVPGSVLVTFSAGGGDNCGVTTYDGNPDISAGPGYAMTPFATGFLPRVANFGGLNNGCRGASGLAFDAVGNLYVSDFVTGNVYRFGPDGGVVGPQTLITPTPLGPGLESMSFGLDGKMYGAQLATTGNFLTGAVIEINPVTGAFVRTVAGSITCAAFVVTDPISGDLFVDDSCAGGGSENGSIWRIADPGSATPTTSVYAATAGVNGGMSFTSGGTLYLLSYHENNGAGGVVSITGTDTGTPGQISLVPGITGPALGVSAFGNDGNDHAQALLLAASPGTDGFAPGIRSYDISADPAATTSLLMNHGYANVQAIGPDGCLYASMSVAVYRITNADGSCPLDVAAPLITLSPSTVAPDPVQGSELTLTASFHNVSVSAGTPVLFRISGANEQIAQVSAGADGTATLAYSGVNAGDDSIVAVATVNGTTLTSDPSRVRWSQGPHTTFVNLNTSPTSGFAGRPITLVASLLDVSLTPNAPIAGATIGFSVDGQTCSAVTAANGVASCSLIVPDVGAFTLTASYSGAANYLPGVASAVFSTAQLGDVIFANGFE